MMRMTSWKVWALNSMTADHKGTSFDTIARGVAEIALGVEGVYALTARRGALMMTLDMLENVVKPRGVRLSFDEKAGVSAELTLIVKYGATIPETAWNVQKRVRAMLDDTDGIEAGNIDIHIAGVYGKPQT